MKIRTTVPLLGIITLLLAPLSASAALVNIASQANGGVATAANTGASALPGNDGNVNTAFLGDFSNGGVEWQVVFNDTGGQAINHLKLFPRQDCCQDRLDDYKVEIFDSVVGGNLLHTITSTTQGPNGGTVYNLNSLNITTARRMVITDQQTGTPGLIHFNFGEAMVISNVGGGAFNVALDKPVTGGTNFGFPPQQGNDGIVVPGSNFSHGNSSTTDSWEVDLLGRFDIDQLDITSRTGLPERTNGATVSLLALDGSTVDSFILGGFTGGDTLTFNNGGAGWNQVAKIHVTGVAFLHLAELAAIGVVTPVPEPSTLTLGALGLIVGLARFRKRRKK